MEHFNYQGLRGTYIAIYVDEYIITEDDESFQLYVHL